MKPTLVSITLFVLVGAINPIERTEPQPVQAVEVQEQPQVPKQTKKPVQTLTEAEKRKQLIQRNPHKCNTSTQWILYPDGTCKDKPVAKAPQPVPQRAVGCEHYRHLVEKYNWNVDTMMYAMQKESGCNPNAVGDNYPINGVYAPSCGLLQVRTLPGRPSCAALKDPATNIETAYRIWQGQGYRAWSVLH